MVIVALYPIRSCSLHPNVSLMAGDEVLFAFEEDKLTRSEGEYAPAMGLHAALNKAGVRPEQVDLWVLVGETENVIEDFTSLLRRVEFIHFVPDVKINRVPHQSAHVALSVFTSTFDECLFVSMDHASEDGCGLMGTFKRNSFQEIHRSTGYHVADFLSDITQHLGFRRFEEDAIVGLSGYGRVDEKLYRELKTIIRLSGDGLGIVYTPPKRTMRQDFAGLDCDHFRLSDTIFPSVHFSSIPYIREVSKPDIAATAQRLAEDFVLEIVANLLRKTGAARVALSGELFMNARVNAALRELPQIEALHVPLAPGDAGLSLGAAFYTFWERSGGKRPLALRSPYLGPAFDPARVEREIRTFGLRYRRTDVVRDAARLIADGKVVGWFQGAGEYGHRPLGSRSVLADPRSLTAREKIHPLAEHGEWPVPPGLSILEEHVDEFFLQACKIPFMNLMLKVREEKRSMIPAALHEDRISLVQTVSRVQNPRFYDLIEEFGKLTGIPALLNTGLQHPEFPPACTPRQALEHLCMGCMDVLAMDDFMVERVFGQKEDVKPEEPLTLQSRVTSNK